MASIVESVLLHRPHPRQQQKPISRHDFPNPRPARAGIPAQRLVGRLLRPSDDVDGSRERHQEGGRGSGTREGDLVAQQCRVVS